MSSATFDTPAERRARGDAGAGPAVADDDDMEVVDASPDDGTGIVASSYGRRDGANQHNALVASAARLNLNDRRAIETTRARRQAWQSEAWDYYDEIGEIGYTLGFLSNLMSKLRLYPAVRPDPDSSPVPVDHEDAKVTPETALLAVQTLARLRSAQGGQSAILREMSLNLEVTGECYLHGHEDKPEYDEDSQPGPTTPPAPPGPDGAEERDVNLEAVEDWQIRSVDELTVIGDQFVLRRGPGAKVGTPIPESDLVVRLWERHPRFSEMATCAMRRVLAEAEALLLLSREIRATAKSRLSNGILLIPSELSFGPIDPTRDSGDGEETDDPFDDELAKAMITPIQEEGSAAAVVPLVIRGPAEALQHVSHIALDKTLDPVLDARIEQRILRIARGLNMPVEVTTGLMATTYANAVQVKQSEFEDHIEPRAVLVCDAVTSGYFQWALEQAGVDPKIARTIFVWYDAGALIIKPDQSEQAGNAHQDGVISDAARRKYQGFTEDDAPPDDEILRRLLLKGGRMDPFIEANLFILTKLAPDMPVPAPPAGILGQEHSVSAMPIPGAPEGPVADPTPSPHPTAGAPTRSTPIAAATRAITTGAAGAGWAGTGARLAAIDRELRARIVGALDQAMRAALERAGNRAKAKAQRDKGGVTHSVRAAADNVAASEVAATVGKAVLNAAGISDDELISGAFTRVLDDVMAWMAAAVAQAEAVVVKAGGPLPDTVARTRAAAVATHLSDAREWLDTNLAHLAALRLYEPTPTAPAEGEYDGTVLIPTGLVRAAIAVAGGTKPHGGTMVAAGWTAIAGGPLTDGGGDPVGGIGTGPDTMGAASAVGAETEAWEWQYGAGTRNPFIPHENLDGSIAASFDDPAWANTSGFPATGYYFPGDHDGCGCDIAPVMVAADSGAVRDQTVSDLGTTAADTSELSTADPAAFADEQGYDRGGSGEISAEDLAAARDELPAVRADIRAEAARIADEHAALLDAMGAGRGAGPGTGHLAFPDAGESWWSALNGQERERIRVNGYLAEKGATGAVSPDEVAQALADVLGRDTSQVAAVDPMMQWVQETRIADAARALANGRAINPDLYGGLDVNAIVESPYDLRDLFANKQIAAQHVAEVNAREAADEADRILGQTVGGPAPWEMTEAQYMAEVVQVDAAAAAATPIANDEWTGPVYSKADQAIMDRFTTLVPPALDDPTNPVSFEQMYREIIRTARIGGLV